MVEVGVIVEVLVAVLVGVQVNPPAKVLVGVKVLVSVAVLVKVGPPGVIVGVALAVLVVVAVPVTTVAKLPIGFAGELLEFPHAIGIMTDDSRIKHIINIFITRLDQSVLLSPTPNKYTPL
jgi:hypothetical protein